MLSYWYWGLFLVAAVLLLGAAVSYCNARYQEARRRERLAYRSRYGTREGSL